MDIQAAKDIMEAVVLLVAKVYRDMQVVQVTSDSLVVEATPAVKAILVQLVTLDHLVTLDR